MGCENLGISRIPEFKITKTKDTRISCDFSARGRSLQGGGGGLRMYIHIHIYIYIDRLYFDTVYV